MPPIIRAEKYRWSKQEIEDLEDAVAGFYTLSFYSYFHHAPVVPRSLSHQASLYSPQTTPNKIKVLEPNPNTFYDVSVLAPQN